MGTSWVCSPRHLGVGDRKVSKAQELETSLGQRSTISSHGAEETAQRLIKSIFLCKLEDWDLDPSMHIHAGCNPIHACNPGIYWGGDRSWGLLATSLVVRLLAPDSARDPQR